MLEEFDKYVSNYDMNIDGIKRKYNHSIRVMNLSVKYARLLGFNDDDIELAGIIGLLHDIGRFEQYTKYKSFNDYENIDHADYGVKVLFDEGLIKKFTNRVKDYDLIKYAISNHNKLKIEKTDNKRYIKFVNLIRDVNKLDTVYLTGYLWEYKFAANGEYISDNVRKCFELKRSINRREILNNNDNLAVSFAFVFDINNNVILKEFRQNIYYFYKRIGGVNIFRDIYNEVIRYIDERIDKNVREEI